jgi:toxin ParE1/3/4
VRRLELTESARADLKSIRRYFLPAWGGERTERYMVALRDTMESLLSGRAVGREREDLRPRLRMATSGRHRIFFEVDSSRVMVIRVLHDRMDYGRHLGTDEGTDDE